MVFIGELPLYAAEYVIEDGYTPSKGMFRDEPTYVDQAAQSPSTTRPLYVKLLKAIVLDVVMIFVRAIA